jgi:transketolase
VLCVDGHDFSALSGARDECERVQQAGPTPVAIIANTIKGRGLGRLQDTVDSHYLPMTDTQYAGVVEELTRAYAARSKGSGDAG